MFHRILILSLTLGCPSLAEADDPSPAEVYRTQIRPVLVISCGDCHDAESDNKARFLSATSVADITAARAAWRNVATQLLNRTMPPADEAQPEEADRLRIATWIEDTLRNTACTDQEYAGVVTTRRLNRREYANTIRDLLGVELDLATTLPVDSGGGEGFDNNGETLFLPPLLLERYLETAQQVVDAAIIPPPMNVMFLPKDMHLETDGRTTDEKPQRVTHRTTNGETALTIPAAERTSVLIPIPVAGTHRIPVGIVPLDGGDLTVTVEVDDIAAATMTYRSYGAEGEANQEEVQLRLTRGLHKISIRAPHAHDVSIVRLRVVRVPDATTPVQIARHMQLLGVQPGHVPAIHDVAARRTIQAFATQAFRRPVTEVELQGYLLLYQRAAQRGDSYEECIKLAMKGVLVAPEFLFRIEQPPVADKLEPLDSYELATRLSYFFWSTQPDEELRVLARVGRLNDQAILDEQVDRLLDDPRSREFSTQFIGQWLGTRDLGGRRAATENSIQDIYTPFIAADMREQAVLLFEHILREDRSLLELIDSDYTFLTGKLAKFYGLPEFTNLPQDTFQHVTLETPQQQGRYGGLLGLGGVLTLTSHISQRETSPVLRGVWVLDTLLGTKIPAPPNNVPALDKKQRQQRKLTLRESLEHHRENPTCAACHDLIDPIGFGLENFDFLGRWRESDGDSVIDATGTMPSGESFRGPAELKQVLLKRQDEFMRQIIRKLLGYALGRSLVDADECTIERLMQHLEQNEYRGRSLIKAIVRSTPFRLKGSSPSLMESTP